MGSDENLIRLAATSVMGWKLTSEQMGVSLAWLEKRSDGPDVIHNFWRPLTDWRAAGEIVDKMRADGWLWDIEVGAEVFAACYKRESGPYPYAQSQSGPRAITIAALLAVGAIQESEL